MIVTAGGAYCYRLTDTSTLLGGRQITYECAGASLLRQPEPDAAGVDDRPAPDRSLEALLHRRHQVRLVVNQHACR